MRSLMRRVLFFGVVWLGLAGATGKGPIGMYAIDERYAIVADSEFNGLLVIDYRFMDGWGRWPAALAWCRLGTAEVAVADGRGLV